MSRANLDVRATELRRQGVPFVRARVVLAERPTSAKAGDEAIIHADGSIEGFVGGTCAETTVRTQSLMLLDTKEPLLLRITPTEEPGQLVHRHDGTLSVHNPCLSGGTMEIFLDPVVPPPLVQVHGAGPVATALIGLAGQLDYQVSTIDRQTLGGALGVIVASHGREEVETLTAALDAGVPYIGLVASRRRAAGVLTELVQARPDLAGIARGRVHSPAGLNIGARTAPEIALSILAEVVSMRVHSAATDKSHPATQLDDRDSAGNIADVAESADVATDQHSANGRPTTAIDPVCGMTVAAVPTSLHLDHDGTRFYFCGPGCLRAFSANPPGLAAGAAPAGDRDVHIGSAGYPVS